MNWCSLKNKQTLCNYGVFCPNTDSKLTMFMKSSPRKMGGQFYQILGDWGGLAKWGGLKFSTLLRENKHKVIPCYIQLFYWKYFFNSSIKTSKLYWSKKWTVVWSCPKCMKKGMSWLLFTFTLSIENNEIV